MRELTSGTTLIELLVYVGLLSLMATLCFGLVLQIRKQNQSALLGHTTLNATQVALELLVRDVRASRDLEIKRNYKLNLACKTDLGTIQWRLDDDLVLLRTDHQTKLKKPIISKVAENIKTVAITYEHLQIDPNIPERLSRIANRTKLVKIAISPDHYQPMLTKIVTLRKTICL